MRVLVVVHGYPPTHSGGAERRAERTARGIAARQHEVCVVAAESASAPHADLRWDDRVQDGVPVHRLYLNLASSPDPFRWSYDNPQIGEAIAKLIEQWCPAILHVFSGYLMSSSVVRVAVASRVPVVVSLTDYWWLCHRINLLRSDGTRCDGPTVARCTRCYAKTFRRYRLPARLWPFGSDAFCHAAGALQIVDERLCSRRHAERADELMRTLRSADALIAPSHHLADLYVRHGVDPDRLRVWRQGVDLHHCLLRPPSEALRVGYVGQMKHHKGVHLLLDAWPRLRGPRPRSLTLYGSDAGEPAYGRHLRNAIRHLEHVRWDGQFHGSEVWQVLANLDVLVVPSRWVENSPNSILEAQAVGVPVVGSKLGGIAELVQHERNGLLFEVDNAVGLARQLQRLLDEPNLLQRLRKAALPVRTFDEELDGISALYEELSQQHKE